MTPKCMLTIKLKYLTKVILLLHIILIAIQIITIICTSELFIRYIQFT